MKKISVLLMVVSLFCVTGCEKDNLVCKMVNDANTEITISESIITGFKEGKMVSYDSRVILDLNDKKTLNKKDELEKNLKEQYKNYEGKTGIIIRSSNKGKRVTVLFTANFEKMDEETRNNFDLISISQTKEELKKDLESQGYTCK